MNRKPNIIFILTDDQGAWAMHCAGNDDIQTPNLDALAERGLRFDNFFCASPVCSPARASILTGRIPSQHGVHDWIRSGNLDKDALGEKKEDPYYRSEEKPIQYLENMTCYTDLLAEKGYQCALAGKWHLGDSMNPQHGFSEWFTIGRGGCLYTKADIVDQGKLYYEDRYITDVLTDKALEYMDELGNGGQPYYLSVHYTAPHDPWDEDQHPAEFVEKYRNCEFRATPDLPVHPNQIDSAPYGTGEVRKSLLRGYYAAVSAMDAGVGRIVQRLKERGELENTLLIFTADNGMNMGHHGIWGKGNGTFPFNLYDTAVKVPFLISWPEKLPQGKCVSSMHSHYDIIHTLFPLLGLEVELPQNLPGRSFADVLLGEETKSGKKGVKEAEKTTGSSKTTETTEITETAETASDEELVIFDEYGPNRMIRTNEWKYIRRYPYGPDELYHLTEDPEEMVNLIEAPECQERICELNRRMTNWYLKYADPKMDGTRERVYGMGQLRKAGVYADGRENYSRLPKKG